MPDFGRPDFGKPAEPSLDEIRRSDGFIDALAGGRPVGPHDAADAELAALLGSWRDETRWPPATGLIPESDAIAEGISRTCAAHGCSRLCACASCVEGGCTLAVDAYADLWRDINGAESWDANPWVWVVSFRVVQP